MNYQVKKTCANCKNVDSFQVSKIEAAFEKYNFSREPCTQCGSASYQSMSHPRPKPDQELLDIWGCDLSLFFMSQDEDIILADPDNLTLILQAIDQKIYLKSKIDVLVSSVCIMLYDLTANQEEHTDEENLEFVDLIELLQTELKKRQNSVICAENYILDYIKKVVFPQIGLE